MDIVQVLLFLIKYRVKYHIVDHLCDDIVPRGFGIITSLVITLSNEM